MPTRFCHRPPSKLGRHLQATRKAARYEPPDQVEHIALALGQGIKPSLAAMDDDDDLATAAVFHRRRVLVFSSSSKPASSTATAQDKVSRRRCEIAQDLGISDVAVGKLCAKLQVPKPPRGYWARVEGGQKPRRPALAAFREEIDVKRKELVRAYAAEFLSKLQRQFFEAALVELKARGVDVGSAETNPGRPLLHLDSNLAAQILLVIQGKAQSWVEDGRVAASWGPPARKSLGRLVERLLPLAREQLLVFETEGRRKSYTADGPAILLRLTGELQKRIAGLSNFVRDQSLQHVIMPLMSVDHAWSTHQLYSPESHMVLESWLCVSAREIWVEWLRKSWRDDEPPERHTTNKITSRAIMPIDFLPVEVKALPPVIAETSIKPYAERLRALQAAEGVFEMVSGAAYAMQREVPAETLSIVERLLFGQERPFQAAREAF